MFLDGNVMKTREQNFDRLSQINTLIGISTVIGRLQLPCILYMLLLTSSCKLENDCYFC